jgi:uncharacterized protein YcbK (DUF882 family)
MPSNKEKGIGDISAHFSRSEFACKCGCGYDTVDTELLVLLEEIRAHFGRGITINSGCRCVDYNASPHIGGSEKSQHLYGRAADIVVEGTPPDIVHELAEQLGAGGLGKYDSFTHVDSRVGRARWG